MNRRSLLGFLCLAPAAPAAALLPTASPLPASAPAGHAALHDGMQKLLAVTRNLDRRLQAMATDAATEALTRRVLAAEASAASLSGA